MTQTAVRRSFESLRQLDFAGHLDDRRKRNSILAITSTCGLWLLIVLAFPASTWLWAARFFGGSDRPWPQKTYLEIAGLNQGLMRVPRGEPFMLRVSARSGSVIPESVHVRWRQAGTARGNASLAKFADNDFRYDFPAIDSDAEVEIAGGDDSPPPFIVHVVDRPRIADLKLIRSTRPIPSRSPIGLAAKMPATCRFFR